MPSKQPETEQPPADHVARMQAKVEGRISDLADFGIVCDPGPHLGWLCLNATNADKLLTMLRRMSRTIDQI